MLIDLEVGVQIGISRSMDLRCFGCVFSSTVLWCVRIASRVFIVFSTQCVCFYAINIMLFKRGDSNLLLRNKNYGGHFPSSERNRPINLRSSPLSYLIKPINYDHQGIVFRLQLSVFAILLFFVCRLPSLEALLS